MKFDETQINYLDNNSWTPVYVPSNEEENKEENERKDTEQKVLSDIEEEFYGFEEEISDKKEIRPERRRKIPSYLKDFPFVF